MHPEGVTHEPVLHMVPTGHCELLVQPVQTPLLVQIGVGFEQSAGTRHATHVWVVVLHFGVAPEHCELLLHPAIHEPFTQKLPDPHCALEVHPVHLLLAQIGVEPLQLAFVTHWTHSPGAPTAPGGTVTGMQIGVLGAQCELSAQP